MKVHDAIKTSLETSRFMTKMYLSDLDDQELLQRPVDSANHIAWQLGHLILAERALLEGVKQGYSAELPEGFAEKHAKDKAQASEPADFYTKAQYLELMERQREGTLSLLNSLSESELDAPAPERIRRVAPTVGALFLFFAMHETAHAGQFVILRRKLGKPVLI